MKHCFLVNFLPASHTYMLDDSPKKKKKAERKMSLGILDRGVQFSYFVFIHNFIRFFTYRLNSADVFKE